MKNGKIKVGSIVRAKNGHVLRCGSSVYPHAVVVSVFPFIMVSEETDMKWSCFSIENVWPIGQAPDDVIQRCMTRIES